MLRVRPLSFPAADSQNKRLRGEREPSVRRRHVLQVVAVLKRALGFHPSVRESRSRPTATSAVPEGATERSPTVDGARERHSHLFLFLSGSCVLPLLWPVFAEADLEMLSALRRLLLSKHKIRQGDGVTF